MGRVRVIDPEGRPLADAPLTFKITAGTSRLAATASAGASLADTLTTVTLADGTASFYYRTTVGDSPDGAVTVVAGPTSLTLLYGPDGAGNLPPTVTLSEPHDGQTLTGADDMQVAAAAADVDGAVVKLGIYADNLRLGEVAGGQQRLHWRMPPGGKHRLYAKATDDKGAMTISAIVDITVLPAVPFTESQGFEADEGYSAGPLRDQARWSTFGDEPQVTDGAAQAGKRALVILPPKRGAIPGRVVRGLGVTGPDQKARYIDFWLKPVADGQSSSFSVSPNQDILFLRRLTTAKLISTYRTEAGPDDRQSARSFPIDDTGRATEWHRITVREDLVYGGMDVYLDGRIALEDLHFASGQNRFELHGHPRQPTHFDSFRVSADNPLFADVDHDGMADDWEAEHRLIPTKNDRRHDLDHDGLTNIREYVLGTRPDSPDTDGDELPDRWETQHGFNPLRNDPRTDLDQDADGDGLSLLAEAQADTDFRKADTDGDGIDDKKEVEAGWDPLSPSDDVDGDGLTNQVELTNGTDPVDYYNGVPPVVTSLVPSDGSLLEGGSIACRVTNAAGEPLVNAPITFTANSAEFGYSPTLKNKHAQARKSLRVRTDASGIARAFVVRADELLEPLR